LNTYGVIEIPLEAIKIRPVRQWLVEPKQWEMVYVRGVAGLVGSVSHVCLYTLDVSVTSKGESNIDFSALDGKLGKGVAEALSTMIREAVVQGIIAVLLEIVKTVGSSPKSGNDGVKLLNTALVVTPPSDTLKRIKLSNTPPVVTPLSDPLKEILDANFLMCLGDEPVMKKSTWRCKGKKRGLPVFVVKKELQFAEKLPPGCPWLYYNNYNPNMDGDDMPRCLDLLFRPTKEMKFFDKELVIAAYIFENNLDPEEVLVPNDHCSGTRKTLLTIMPSKLIICDVLTLVCSMLTKGHFGPKGSKYGNQWFLPMTFF
ncbi:hypothetical protein S245_036488, partial [Arachis hypogaea]